jgi:anti-sigma B factor antagonist
MIINKTEENSTILFELEGRLDTSGAEQLQEVLIPAFDMAKEVLLNFEKLAFVSPEGLRVLLKGQRKANAKEGSMTLCNIPEEIMEVFEITGFPAMLAFVETFA